MSKTDKNAVSLFIEGKVNDTWESYEVDSDLLTPADAWCVTLMANGQQKLPIEVSAGAQVSVRVGEDLVMVGQIDEVIHEVGKHRQHFRIAGRDNAAALLDCSSALFTVQMVGLSELVAKIVSKFKINKHRIEAEKIPVREKISVQPGVTAWDTLQEVAAKHGLWPWFEPDGTLVVGGPDYEQPPVATLVMRKDGRGNNVLSLKRRHSIAKRYSEVTVLGQRRGTDYEQGKHALKATEKDTGVSCYRPLIVQDSEAESEAMCRSRALKIIADSRISGFTLEAHVPGHRISAPGQPADGLLWKPGQRVHVISEPHGIDTVLFLMARTFTGGRDQAPRTTLVLKEDRAWGLNAYPQKNKHRHKKDSATLQILDLTKG